MIHQDFMLVRSFTVRKTGDGTAALHGQTYDLRAVAARLTAWRQNSAPSIRRRR